MVVLYEVYLDLAVLFVVLTLVAFKKYVIGGLACGV